MINNDILRRLRYALNISNSDMAEIFSHSGYEISEGDILDLLKKEEEDGYAACSDKILCLFLDGLVIHKRGRKEGEVPAAVKPSSRLTNNDILKKIRVALNFKDDDMLEIFRLAEFPLSKSELSALFRKKDNKNFKLCKDQLMKAFLNGLTIRYRK
ncbi:MAG TPA: DUF1456 family protein [Spirochaetota bacterium]|nr:DUF1456 family protein [Spirochaetota bacterium]HPF06906.1 DUF1456 family protein [Spirochaetota bacterium]HPJ43190.1 DUF1456 family protein [Spirochaetota bacterium]HPR38140.1 DUF1456 family protein [Spirochaetota bacterium]HRX48399.1 DUF1456 family protein [Spirochaetota bacterium]